MHIASSTRQAAVAARRRHRGRTLVCVSTLLLVAFSTFEEGNLQYHMFLRIESEGLTIRDCLRFDAAKGEWSRADTGVLGVPFAMPVADQISNWEPVSGEEYGKLLAAYQEMVYELA